MGYLAAKRNLKTLEQIVQIVCDKLADFLHQLLGSVSAHVGYDVRYRRFRNLPYNRYEIFHARVYGK